MHKSSIRWNATMKIHNFQTMTRVNDSRAWHGRESWFGQKVSVKCCIKVSQTRVILKLQAVFDVRWFGPVYFITKYKNSVLLCSISGTRSVTTASSGSHGWVSHVSEVSSRRSGRSSCTHSHRGWTTWNGPEVNTLTWGHAGTSHFCATRPTVDAVKPNVVGSLHFNIG